MDERYANRKNGLEMVEYPHPSLKEILKETLGIFLYRSRCKIGII
jgi:DNA polymerase III alpha subunit